MAIKRTASAAVALACALAIPQLAQAQAYQCSLPRTVELPHIEAERPRRLPVSGYTLALSWAPEFCRFRESEHRDAPGVRDASASPSTGSDPTAGADGRSGADALR